MAWQIAIVADQGESEATLHANLYILLGQMPVWVIAATGRLPAANELREQWEGCWAPEPALTSMTPTEGAPSEQIVALISTLQGHHPRMCALRLFGVDASSELTDGLARLDFLPIAREFESGIMFSKPVERIGNLPVLELNAAGWKSNDDFFDEFFRAVGAPSWHGRNFNALIDSISTGSINEMEVPYRIVICNAGRTTVEARKMIDDFKDLIGEIQGAGCPVSITVND